MPESPFLDLFPFDLHGVVEPAYCNEVNDYLCQFGADYPANSLSTGLFIEYNQKVG
jgi:hypothetical protein